jgi:Ca2+-binding RTX toxin-like protein
VANITGTNGNDSLVGTSVADTIQGLDGNDTLVGNAGNDTLNGGNGNDRYVVGTGDVLADSGGTDTVESSITWTLGAGFENLVLTGTTSTSGHGNALSNVITGSAGSNWLRGLEGNDTISAGAGNDVINMSNGSGASYGNDVIDGGDGVDTLDYGAAARTAVVVDLAAGTASGGGTGGAGSATLTNVENVNGSAFDDRITGNSAANFLFGFDGNDNLSGGAGNDRLEGAAGQDNLYGGDGADTLDGGASAGGQANLLDGGAGADSMVGGADGDVFLVDNVGDVLLDSGGFDAVFSSVSFVAADWVEQLALSGSASINATAGNSNNSVYGNTGANLLRGLGGNDYLDGSFGNDTLDGGSGFDQFAFTVAPGSADADTIAGFASGTDKIVLWGLGLGTNGNFTSGDARFNAGAGFNAGQDASDRLVYNTSTGQLWYDADGSGSAAAQLVATLQGAPTLAAADLIAQNSTSSNVVINGTARDDTLSGGAGDDTIFGEAGYDRLFGLDGNDLLDGGTQDDYLEGGAGSDTLIGGANDDRLDGGAGDDSIYGGDGNDYALLRGSYGNDFLDGGAGRDFVDMVDGGLSGIVVDLRTGSLSGGGDGGSGSAVLVSIEGVLGTSFADRMIAGGGAVTFVSWGGNDTLIGGVGDDFLGAYGVEGSSFTGGAGNDSIRGGKGADSIDAGAGNDLIELNDGTSFNGADTVDGGIGIDTLDLLSARSGLDVDLSAGTITGGGWDSGGTIRVVNVETVFGGWHDDRLVGDGAANLLDARDGADSLDGGGGNDTLYGAYGADTLQGGGGNDLLFANTATTPYDDQDHFLAGGTGNDTLTGGSGRDVFAFSETPGAPNADVIAGFTSGLDAIQLDSAFHANLGSSGGFTAGDDRFWAAAGASSGHDATDRVVYDTLTGNLYYDADGSAGGAAQLIARLDGAPSIAASDIWVDVAATNLGINGTAGNDSLRGASGRDTLSGFGGDDTLDGGYGDDRLDGGSGNDVLAGNEGADLMLGAEGNDTLDGAFSTDSWYGEQTWYWDGTTSQPLPGDTLNGGLGDDKYYQQWNDVIVDAGGIDTVFTDQGEYTLPGGLENLTYTTFGFSDGEGYFIDYTGNELNNIITVPGLWYSSSTELDGGDGNDVLIGAGGYSTFKFSAGSGNYGNDTLHGAGSATIDFADARSAIFADLNAGTMTGGGTGGSGSAVLHDIHNLIGGAFNDRMSASAFGSTSYYGDLPGSLEGRGGNDTLEGIAGGHGYELSGGDGNDRLVARGPEDMMHGGTGADQFVFARAAGGNPYGTYHWSPVVGDFASGSDKIVLDASYMAALGVSGNFSAGDGRFYAAAGATAGHDTDDRVIYNTSTNELYYDADGSGAAAALLLGDLQPGAALVATDFAVENGTVAPPPPTGGQTINGTTGNDTLTGGAGNDTIHGLAGNDLLQGLGGNDSIVGATGWDTLQGGDGDDRLYAGGWSDTMTGGAGADSFVFAETGSNNRDTVTDFQSGTDELLFDNATLTALGANSSWAAGDARFWAAAGVTAGHDADDRLVYNTTTGNLYYDADGSGAGAAQVVATFTGAPGIVATDITVI